MKNPLSSKFKGSRYVESITVSTTPYTLDEDSPEVINVDATLGNMVINLPAISDVVGRMFVIRKIDSSDNTVTVDPDGSQTIQGDSDILLESQYQSAILENNGGTVWFRVSASGGGGGTVPGASLGEVVFVNGSAELTTTTNFKWDNMNTRLGIGTDTPLTTLHVSGDVKFASGDPGFNWNNADSLLGIGGTADPDMAVHIFSGNLKVEGVDDMASIRLQRTETVDGSINPEFKIGGIISGGVNLPMLCIQFTDQDYTDKYCFIVESSGTCASVSDGVRRSHYEAFIQNGDVDPIFRMNSSPYMTMEFGSGGSICSPGGMVRTSNVTVVTTDTPHDMAVGNTFHMSNTEANFPELVATTGTVTVVDSPTVFRFADPGADATSTIAHHISSTVDVQLSRIGPFTARMSLGGGAKTTWYPTTMVFEPGYDLKIAITDGVPLFWASAGYDRVGIGVTVPGARLHVQGAEAAEVVTTFQGPSSHVNNLTMWLDSDSNTLAYVSQYGEFYASTLASGQVLVTPNVATGLGTNYNGNIRYGHYRATITYTAFTGGSTTDSVKVCTIPAKCRVVSVVLDTPFLYYIAGAGTIDASFGCTDGGDEYILAHDVQGATTAGLVDADLGTGLARATAVQGGHIPSFTGTTDLYMTIDSDQDLVGLAAGQSTVYITVEFL